MTQQEQDLEAWANQVTQALHQFHQRLSELEWEVENLKARLAEWETGPH